MLMRNSPIKVLIADDSSVARRLIREIVAAEPDMHVVGEARDGRDALERVRCSSPDVVTLDVEMPNMDGLQALRAIRAEHKSIDVIMFSATTERAASVTIEALRSGAADYVTKPAGMRGLDEAKRSIREELVPKIRALCNRAGRGVRVSTALPLRAPRTPPVEIVAIASSTGGPNALFEVLQAVPKDFPVPIVIVQHMPVEFTRLFAERLDRSCAVSVREAQDGDHLTPGGVWIAKGGLHLELRRESGDVRVAMSSAAPENSCRPAADVTFRSVAALFGAATLGVVLTGMGRDGLAGCKLIHTKGGSIIVQDEATSIVWGMPGFVAEAGLASKILPLPEIGLEIVKHVTRKVGC